MLLVAEGVLGGEDAAPRVAEQEEVGPVEAEGRRTCSSSSTNRSSSQSSGSVGWSLYTDPSWS